MTQEFDYSIVKNPQIFRINRLDAHSDHEYIMPSENTGEGSADFRFSLNGVWRFSWAKNYASAVRGFESSDYDTRAWDTIRVPAHIQMEGYGHGTGRRKLSRVRSRRNSTLSRVMSDIFTCPIS